MIAAAFDLSDHQRFLLLLQLMILLVPHHRQAILKTEKARACESCNKLLYCLISIPNLAATSASCASRPVSASTNRIVARQSCAHFGGHFWNPITSTLHQAYAPDTNTGISFKGGSPLGIKMATGFD